MRQTHKAFRPWGSSLPDLVEFSSVSRLESGKVILQRVASLPSANGGSIEITANSVSDTATRDQSRMHLGHIAKILADGNFKAPMLIHEQTQRGCR